MYVDALTIAAVADELRAAVSGGRVQDVLATDALGLGFELYANHQRHYLQISADPRLARIHLASGKLRRGVETPSPLLLLLRKWVEGATLEEIEQPPFERILHLGFDHPQLGTSRLIVEIMGRYSNIILVDDGGTIMDSVKRVGPDMNRYRVTLPRHRYVPPPPQQKLPLDQITELRLRGILEADGAEDPAWRALVRGLSGTSPLLAREACYRAYGKVEIRREDVERISPLLGALRDLIAPLSGGTWAPSIALSTPDGDDENEAAVLAFAPYSLTHYPRCAPIESISRAIEMWMHAGGGEVDTYRVARGRLEKMLDEALEKVRHRRRQLREQLASLEDLEALRLNGELILAYGWGLSPGQKELVVDLGDGEPPRVIPIDPSLSPADNAQTYFDRYQKAKRSRAGIPPLLEEAELEIERLEQLRLDLQMAENRAEIDDVKAELIDLGYAKGKARKRRAQPAAGPHTFTTPGGLTVLVGRNSRQNDYLTFKMASADDLWLHARGLAGAHAILRTGGETPPPEAIQRAAELAAYYSSGRDDTRVEVDYTERRHVRRRPGGSPGQVFYRNERTITVQPRP